MSRVANKVAIVTGAASGKGLGIAQLFTKEGPKVVFSDINSKSGKTAADTASGKNALFIECDVSDVQSVKNGSYNYSFFSWFYSCIILYG